MAISKLPDRPGRWALVTGASSGIGLAFARALRRRGWHVAVAARRIGRLRQLVEELGGESVARAIQSDLGQPDGPARLVAMLEAEGVELDLLVNNAGLGQSGLFADEPGQRALEIVDVNVRAVVDLTRRVLPGLVARRRGAILNVVSMSAFQPVPRLAVYAASKAFVLSFTEALSVELAGTGVRVQALCPGNVPTGFQAAAGTAGTRFDRTPGTAPEVVVESALDALDRGTVTVIPTIGDKLTVFAQRFVPRALSRRVAGELLKHLAPPPPQAVGSGAGPQYFASRSSASAAIISRSRLPDGTGSLCQAGGVKR